MYEMGSDVAVVTGASTGIGEAAAKRFAREGASVVIGDVNVTGGEDTVADISAAGGEATFVETDVGDPADIESLVESAVGTYGGLDYALNNAGIEGEDQPTADQSLQNWEEVVDTNLRGVFLGMRAEIDAMVDDGGGAIVNTSSIAGLSGFPESGPYAASKHGVIGLTRTAAAEYGAEDIRVNAVCPGVIDTPMLDTDDQEMIAGITNETPLGRLGTAEEIGDAVVWLCSKEASFVTGEYLVVDGGFTSH